jgi:Uma2 family endonuclease
MDAVLDRPMTLETFLAWERRQELRYEFDGAGPVDMNGGTQLHGLIALAAIRCLTARLAGTAAIVFPSGVKIIVAGRVRYPDAVVTYAPLDPTSDIIRDPVLVIEVLSPSTQETDRIDKNAEYAATPSIRHYVMLEQTARAATIFSREGADWTGRLVLADGTLALTALGIDVPLAGMYGDLLAPGADAARNP